ncbi:Cytochrome c oxidase subunit 7 [Candidozyma auris]
MDPQRIIKLQKIYQNSNQKLWLRGPRSKALVYPYYALFTVSTAVPLYYLGRALFGIKADQIRTE